MSISVHFNSDRAGTETQSQLQEFVPDVSASQAFDHAVKPRCMQKRIFERSFAQAF
jgi:hypothetical protein